MSRSTNSRRIVVITLIGIVIVGIGIFITTRSSSAITSADWQAGNIISDSVFTDNGSMSVSDIQNFLNSKVPTCDTNGTQKTSSGITRAQYAVNNGYPAPPYVCVRDYYENPTTHETNFSGSIPTGALSAAQIIKNAADTYKISPKVLLVLIQKESSLLTDTWPFLSQYKATTGYACPDTSVCDSAFFGFYNQVTSAARQYRLYLNNPGTYRIKPFQNNAIAWSPNATCGSSTIYLQSAATAALYIYTPFQPNTAALNNLYGTGDSCSAYGNRNFWTYYNNWFGSTFAPTYYAEYVSQEMYSDPELTRPLPFTVAAGQKAYIRISLKNSGTAAWTKGVTNLATSNPSDRKSVFQDTSWSAVVRPTTLQEDSVPPGSTGSFVFAIRAPGPGNYLESFNPVQEGVTWFNNLGISLPIHVVPGYFSSTTPNNTIYMDSSKTTLGSLNDLSPGSKRYIVTKVTNTSNTTWEKESTFIGTFSPANRASFLVDSSWVSSNRTAAMNESLVYPGQTATFEYWVTASQYPGRFIENFRLVVEGVAWIDGANTFLDVVSSSPTTKDTLSANTSLSQGTELVSNDGKYKLMLQTDGNLVIYNVYGAPLWSSNTYLKGGSKLTMQQDGNLVLYGQPDSPLWSSGTDIKTPSIKPNKLVMQPDGNLVIYNANNSPLWSSGTDKK